MKKYFVMILVAISVMCAVAGIACVKGPKYYTLTYQDINGITFVSEVWNEAEVKEGYEVKFSVEIDWNRVAKEDENKNPVIKANDTVLTADSEGVYSFVMQSSTQIKVEGVYERNVFRVTFDKGEPRQALYTSEDGDTEEGIYVPAGEEITFNVVTSSYYVGDYKVYANTRELNTESDGSYKFTVTENTTVSVKGLTQDTAFNQRADGGTGTEADPFKIEKPIDLYLMADIVGNSYYNNRYVASYFEMQNDIDMKGEQLYIIGDGTSNGSVTSFFGGHFNGNGYTISNYYILDSIIEQSAFTKVFIPNIGLFGYAGATELGPAEIANVNLKNFEIVVNAVDKGVLSVTGGLVGFGAGVNITGCSVTNGKITVNGDYNYFSYVGGLAGQLESVYQSDALRFNSVVRSCYSDVEVAANSGYVYAAGGLVGHMTASDEKTNCVVVNSYSTGDVYGAINCGGVVGFAGSNTAVLNSYATGSIEAFSSVTDDVNNNDLTYAYAGGLVGNLNYGAIVANSFFTGEVYAESSLYERGVTGPFAANIGKVNKQHLDSFDAYIYNSYSNEDEVVLDKNFIKNTLNWQETDWVFNDSGYPAINFESTTHTYTVTIETLGQNSVLGTKTFTVKDAYMPMYDWNLKKDSIPEFVSYGNRRSYAYYFDKECKYRLPYAFIPTGEITLYAATADYSEVAGRYYIGNKSNNEYIELSVDGGLDYRKSALNYNSYFTYDGQKIMFYDCPAFLVTIGIRITGANDKDESKNYNYYTSYYSARGSVGSDGELTIVNMLNTSMVDLDLSTKPNAFISSQKSNLYTDTSPLKIVSSSAETYPVNDAYKGTWIFNYVLPVDITFNGVTEKGYGTAEINYTNSNATVEYVIDGSGNLKLYNKDVPYGNLSYVSHTNTLLGSLYVPYGGGAMKSVMLCKYDDLRGTWISNNATISELKFDGLGNYDLASYGDSLAVKGKVIINNSVIVPYSNGKFTYNGVEYTATVSGDNISVTTLGNFDQRDNWFDFDLVAANGDVYSFDGRGNFAGGGKYTVTKPDGTTTEGTYKASSITVSGNSYLFNNVTLHVHNYFTTKPGDEWLVGATEGDTLEIGEIGPNDGKLTATGKYNTSNIIFEYDRNTKSLSYGINGHKYTLRAMSSANELYDSDNSISYIKRDKQDVYFGKYVDPKDSNHFYVLLDGFMNSKVGAGTAIVSESLSNGVETVNLIYDVDRFNHIVLRDPTDKNRKVIVKMVSCGASDIGALRKEGTDEYYKLIEPDVFYYVTTISIYGVTEGNSLNKNEVYTFDGIGTVYCKDGNDFDTANTLATYNYVIKEQTDKDKLDTVYRMVFKDSENKEHNVTLDYGASPYKVIFG